MNKELIAITLTLLLAFSSFGAFASQENSPSTSPQSIEQPVVSSAILSKDFTLSAKSTNFGQVELSWSDDPSATGYIVYKYDLVHRQYRPLTTITNHSTTSFVDTDTNSDQVYHYQVTPTLAKSQHINSNIVSITTTTAIPLVDVAVEGIYASISWEAVSDATAYELYRSTSSDTGFEKLQDLTDTSYIDTDLSDGQVYYYRVRALQDNKATDFSLPACTGILNEKRFIWPIPAGYGISAGFGYRNSPTRGASSYHKGIDIPAPQGSQVLSGNSGRVIEVSYNGLSGHYLVISHDNGLESRYLHLSSTKVAVGDRVDKGQVIALSGNTGVSTGAHLHFEVHESGVAVDPTKFL